MGFAPCPHPIQLTAPPVKNLPQESAKVTLTFSDSIRGGVLPATLGVKVEAMKD
jgi:hypothetical protein